VADDVKAAGRVPPVLHGDGLRIAVAASRFNDHVTLRLLDGARRALAGCSVAPADVLEVWVPGAFELPLAARALAGSGRVDAVVCVGCVIRGDTAHFEHVATQCAAGIQRVALDTGLPVMFGVLTVDTLEQALERSEPAGGHNVGEEAAMGAIEMARLVQQLRTG
jgi:6,7-dimethyl-8-ribityllumazine synthase